MNLCDISRFEEITGYKLKTTFYKEVSLSEEFGKESIIKTCKRHIDKWISNYKYMTEISFILHWKIWGFYEEKNMYSFLYQRLWEQVDKWCLVYLKGKELEYYHKVMGY